MRARNLKPGFFKNEYLLSLSPLHRLLFEGLWCMADRNGILEDRPAKIKIEILPMDNCSIDQMLDELSTAGGLIRRIEIDGQRYIEIKNFVKHQKPHPREPALYPTPEEKQGNVTAKQEIAAAGRVKEVASKAYISSSLNASSLNVKDSKDSCSFPNQNERVSSPTENSSPKKTPKSKSSPNGKEAFHQFWRAYPRKVAKGRAEKIFTRIHPDMQLLTVMLTAVERAKASDSWQKEDGKYIPHPATWLNDKRWEDDFETERKIEPINRLVKSPETDLSDYPIEKEVDPVALEASRAKLKAIFSDLGQAKAMPG